MPAWWGKKSGRSKDSETSAKGSSVKNEKKRVKESDNKARSFDEVLLQQQQQPPRNSPRNSRDFSAIGRELGGGNSSGFSGFDSASSLERGHPLPRPLEPSNDHVHGSGPDPGRALFRATAHLGRPMILTMSPLIMLLIGWADFLMLWVSNLYSLDRGHGENRSSPLLRSPGRGLRCTTTATSPLHARLSGINLDSPAAKLEDGRSECHRLPLPPGSPASPSALPTPRSPGITESSCSNSSKWRKGRLLGRGTFGHVYLGFNSENGQMCAIKEVKVVSDDQSSKESLKQLNQEVALLSQLSHANIVQYYGSDLIEDRLSLYLEFSGLAYLHGRNTVHRDIKGANILVDPNGEIKLADFGMAKHIASCSSMLSFKGSPYWMAPEVVMNTNGYSLAVDIWSLGCTVLEMATSKPPWSQFEGVAAIFKIGNSKDIPEIPEHLSADAKSFILLCLQREPSARPTAAQLHSPFVRNQTTARATNVNITREAFPRAFDGSRTPTALEMHSSRMHNSSSDRDDASRLTVPRTLISPRDNARTITSLPVSPSSSPLRHDGAAHRSFFLSPPHPSYTSIGQSNQNYSDRSVFPLRPNSRSSFDPWLEIPQFRSQTPVRPRREPSYSTSKRRQKISNPRTPVGSTTACPEESINH
ncbi:UNVERIFIED_CONTAM: Mitogen-activated protein kinase kinase kinase [Sesamum latifolium]|uniref:mitogen-activated protein kinase kinase kinase n=1 Tax=Sesamum latifolium TaxID=2727402 RepID=A0AAW2X711_9LAMI